MKPTIYMLTLVPAMIVFAFLRAGIASSRDDYVEEDSVF